MIKFVLFETGSAKYLRQKIGHFKTPANAYELVSSIDNATTFESRAEARRALGPAAVATGGTFEIDSFDIKDTEASEIPLGYYIRARNDLGHTMWLGNEPGCGYTWSGLHHADRFTDLNAAKALFESTPFTQRIVYGDGTHRAPRLIDTAIEISNAHPKGHAEIDVVQLIPQPVFSKTYDQDAGEIPERYRKEQDLRQQALAKLTPEERAALKL